MKLESTRKIKIMENCWTQIVKKEKSDIAEILLNTMHHHHQIQFSVMNRKFKQSTIPPISTKLIISHFH